ncbi:Uu.00g027220.m01.CDS01 [Anthostomella pinea]|uniref:Cutinase n=1 Tax=Anthostomella pinea TaxID=933095 RepID=A0AAI8V7J7_9PEZI|nr:Uu.00g027220.m01.CDS01 [Anthostomella pinea]
MHTPLLLAGLLLALAAATPNTSQQKRQEACSAVHIFLARGNNEPYPGRQGVLVDAICEGLESCDYEGVMFNNALETNYCTAVAEGAVNGVAQMEDYYQRCPDTKLVLSGYSQGAQVVGDIIGGGGGSFFDGCVQPESAGLDPYSGAGTMLTAALTFGDVRHTANQPFNTLGGASRNSGFPRSGTQLANLNRFADVIQDYCADDDIVCASGDSVADHLNYFDVYTQQAADWVKMKLGDVSTEPTTSSSVPVETSTPVPSMGATSTLSTTVTVSSSSIATTTGATTANTTTTEATTTETTTTEATTTAATTTAATTTDATTTETTTTETTTTQTYVVYPTTAETTSAPVTNSYSITVSQPTVSGTETSYSVTTIPCPSVPVIPPVSAPGVAYTIITANSSLPVFSGGSSYTSTYTSGPTVSATATPTSTPITAGAVSVGAHFGIAFFAAAGAVLIA